MSTLVISQSMYFPWLGVFEQLRIADMYCFYDDVQFSRGFYNRVQLQRNGKSRYISVPIIKKSQNQIINTAQISYQENWILDHRNKLKESLADARYANDAIEIFEEVVSSKSPKLIDINKLCFQKLANYLGLFSNKKIYNSQEIKTGHKKNSSRLLEICQQLGAKVYLTGHGAMNYLDHELFEKNGIEVHYIKYRFDSYERRNRDYTPYLSSLDPIAHLGVNTKNSMQSETVYWRDAIKNPSKLLPNFNNEVLNVS